jgi:chromosome segregation ATPase
MEGVMDKMNDAKDEAFAKGEEIDELRTQLRKAEIDKNRADDRLELLTADKEEAELNANKLQEQIDATIRDYETRIDNVTMKYLDKIEKLNKDRADVEDQLHELQDEHDNATSNLKSTLEELSSCKFAYERRIENLEKDLDSTVQTMDRKIKSLEDELNKVHDENDGLARERQKLMIHIRNLETDRDEAIDAHRRMDEQLNVERDEHDAAIDQTKNNFSQVSHHVYCMDANLL